MLWCNLILIHESFVHTFGGLPLSVSGTCQELRVNLDCNYLTLMWSWPFLQGLTINPLPRMFLITKWRASLPYDQKEIHQMRSPRTMMHEATFGSCHFLRRQMLYHIRFSSYVFPTFCHSARMLSKTYSYSRFEHWSRLSMIFIPSFFYSFFFFFLFTCDRWGIRIIRDLLSLLYRGKQAKW